MKYLKLLRVKHYIKNFLICFPLFFSGLIFDLHKLKYLLLGYIIFCLTSSCIYIINDIKDLDIDKKNKYKNDRPIASGVISVKEAYVVFAIVLVINIIFIFLLHNLYATLCLLLYFVFNIIYTYGGKNTPLLDITILVSGFIIRVVYGSVLTNILVSNWLYLTVFAFAFFFSLCKRRNELVDNKEIEIKRKVLKYYNKSFLDKNMYVFLCMGIVFYALWTIDSQIRGLIWSVPIVSIISLQYSLIVEGDSSGDPIEVIYNNKFFCILLFLYVILMFLLIYHPFT